MKLKNRILIIGLPLILAACTTTQPSKFYLLNAMETTGHRYNSPRFEHFTVLVKPIKFPEYLDRPQMVLRDNNYKLQFNEFHRWAEPLKDNFIRVFMESLNSRIAPGSALFFSDLDGIQANYQLTIEVFQLDVNANNQAVLRVKWDLLAGKNNQSIKRKSEEYRIPFEDSSYQSGVKAQSKTIALLTDQITKTLRDSQSNSEAKNEPTLDSYSGFQQ